jgi:hypothetical protein
MASYLGAHADEKAIDSASLYLDAESHWRSIDFVMWQHDDEIYRICEEHFDTMTIPKTITLALEWIKYIKQIDGTAEWSWQMVELLFPDSI